MKNLIQILIFSLLINILLPVYPASAQNDPGKEPVWLPANPESKPESPAQTEVENIDSHTLDVTIAFSGVWAQVQTGDGQSYTRLWHEDYSSYREPGQPALPGVTFNILIPQGVQAEVIQQKTSSHSISLPRQGLPSKIIPAQRLASKSEPPPVWTPPDPARYASRSAYPQNWYAVKDSFQMRDYTILPLWVNPVRYRPANGEIELLESIVLRLTWPELSTAALDAAVVSDSPSFDRLVSQIVINPPAQTTLDATKADTGEGYLIITPDEFMEELIPFVEMKESQGYLVDITLLSEIPGFDGVVNSEDSNILAIQNYIKTMEPPPVYLLLVGDTNFIPAPTGEITQLKTDLYYGTLDGDFIPDIHIGRLPGRSITDISVIVSKLISYTNDDHQDWHSKASFIATCDDDFYLVAEGSHNHVIEEYTAPFGFLGNFPESELPIGGDQLYCISNDADELDIISRINDGRGLITYSGHGFSSAWYDGAITIFDEDISKLIDNNVFSFVSSFACSTNNFGSTSDPIGFGETWMIIPNKGAVAFIGSAGNTQWGQDDVLERAFYDSVFINPLNPNKLREALSYGLSKVEEKYPGSATLQAQYYWETYNLLGDPSQQLWLLPRNLFYLPIIYK